MVVTIRERIMGHLSRAGVLGGLLILPNCAMRQIRITVYV